MPLMGRQEIDGQRETTLKVNFTLSAGLGLPLEYWLHRNGKKLPVVPHFYLSPLCVRLS
ncbi:hypothetical protein ES332_A07G127800v1 [Gossypium tomentosum]|uniref:Uncharacterized protein n=1 Tax=Gossypium tomentosum TaxID=34277 RepID=A0A5D2PVF4_GOSTO|nr:hypothetical protein ES332_A07G127800v1 [Gossypium tomentosum]